MSAMAGLGLNLAAPAARLIVPDSPCGRVHAAAGVALTGTEDAEYKQILISGCLSLEED
jgi:hypothetical protein